MSSPGQPFELSTFNIATASPTQWLTLAGITFFLLFLVQRITSAARKPRLPPGPKGWPLFGAIFHLEKRIYRSFDALSKKYGPVMHLRLGVFDAVVISDVKSVQELFKIRDAEFSSRPYNTIQRLCTKYIGFEGEDIGFQGYNAKCKHMRKIVISELLTVARVNATAKIRSEEIGRMVGVLMGPAQTGETVKLRDFLMDMTTNVVSRMMFGKRYFGSDLPITGELTAFRVLLHDMAVLMGTFNIADLIPALEWLDPMRLLWRFKDVQARLHQTFGAILEEHRQTRAKRIVSKDTLGDLDKDFVDLLLELEEKSDTKLSENALMGILNDVLSGGTHNSPTAVEWALAELVRHPAAMAKLRREIDEVVGKERAVTESDFPKMPYLEAVVKETFRMHTPVPLLLPRANEAASTLGGFHIPKNTTLFVNTWAMNRDPEQWREPLRFDPDRFLESGDGADRANIRGNCLDFIPFGSGRRMCLGINLGMTMVQTPLASLVHAFDWSPKKGTKAEDIDLDEDLGFALRMATPLVLDPTARKTATHYL